jgi:very-short-patch-repair endonuclease
MEILISINGIPITNNFTQKLPFNSKLKGRAKALRKAYNFAEVAFWKEIHKGKFHNIDFDRQRIIGNYIVDFYIKSLGVVLEIDGSSHENKEVYDEKRTAYLQSYGLRIFRMNDYNVLHDMGNVLKKSEEFIIEHFAI